MTVKYEFENKEGKKFLECSGEKQVKIIKAILEDRCEYMSKGSGAFAKKSSKAIFFHEVYRTLEATPTPNVIDWPLVPPEYKFLYTNERGGNALTVRLPVERESIEGWSILQYRGLGGIKLITEGDYGFKRGTVESIDSLLVRPVGE